MSEKFTDYCASNITPQMTLLEKLNAIIKYLKENSPSGTHLFIHKYLYAGFELSFISTSSELLSNNEIVSDFNHKGNHYVFNPVIEYLGGALPTIETHHGIVFGFTVANLLSQEYYVNFVAEDGTKMVETKRISTISSYTIKEL